MSKVRGGEKSILGGFDTVDYLQPRNLDLAALKDLVDDYQNFRRLFVTERRVP